MRLKCTKRRDGTMRIEAIGEWAIASDYRKYAIEPNQINITLPHDNYEHRPIRVGDEGCMCASEHINEHRPREIWLYADDDGLPGNSNAQIKRLHGWRGTNNDVAVHAYGWRRVESIEPRKRGVGYVVMLSRDLKPDVD